MKNKLSLIFVPLLILSTIISVVTITGRDERKKNNESGKIEISTTIFPVYDIAKNVVGEKVKVNLIVPVGKSPHSFTPSPKDIEGLMDSKLIFYIGQNADEQSIDSLKNVLDSEFVDLSESVELLKWGGELHDNEEDEHDDHEHGEYDPHYWLSAENAKLIATKISKELQELDPENAKYYVQNEIEYLAQLEILGAEVQDNLSNIENRYLVPYHNSFRYFAHEFGFEVPISILENGGVEPTPKHVEELGEIIADLGIKAIFTEPQLSDFGDDNLKENLSVKIGVLDPLGGMDGRETYIDLIRYNSEILRDYLE